MASNYVCKICGLGGPPFFALSTSGKVPLCASDLGKFVSAQGLLGHTILPIEALSFVHSLADVPAYNQRSAEMAKCVEKAEGILKGEGADFQAAIEMVQELKQTAVSTLEAGIEEMTQRLTKWHSEAVGCLVNATLEFQAAKSTQEIHFGEVSQAIYSRLVAPEQQFTSFSECVRQTKSQLLHALETTMKLEVANTHNFVISHVTAAAKKESIPEKRPAGPILAISAPEKKPKKQPTCQQCKVVLSDTNWTSLEGHEQCLYCFACIVAEPLTCLGCEEDYSILNLRVLEGKIPEFPANLKKATTKSAYPQCISCRRSKKLFHLCSGTAFCNECCEREISQNYSGSTLCCRCGTDPLSVPGAVLKCSVCCKKKQPTEIVHICTRRTRLNRICEKCKPHVNVQGRCIMCGNIIDPK